MHRAARSVCDSCILQQSLGSCSCTTSEEVSMLQVLYTQQLRKQLRCCSHCQLLCI